MGADRKIDDLRATADQLRFRVHKVERLVAGAAIEYVPLIHVYMGKQTRQPADCGTLCSALVSSYQYPADLRVDGVEQKRKLQIFNAH